MPELSIPFIGGAYEGRSKSLNAQRSINMFPVYDKNEAKVPIAMYGTPGTVEFSDTEYGTYEVRGMIGMGSLLYAVVGDRVFKVSSNGTATAIDINTDLTTTSGYIGMATNGVEVAIVDGTDTIYIVDSTTITEVTAFSGAEDMPDFSDIIFYDGYFVAVEESSGRFFISASYDGTTWAALDFATAESKPDNTLAIRSTLQNIWMLGERSTEVYYNSGNADFPIERVLGAVNDIGCGAIGSAVVIDGAVYWYTNKHTVVRSDGYKYTEVSTPTLNYQFSTYSTTNNARGFFFEVEGNMFYAINFPTATKTWVLNTKIGDWFEWKTGSTHFRGICSVKWFDEMLVGDRGDSRIFKLDMDTYTDDGETINRVRRAQIINKNREKLIHRKIELDFEFGVGLNVAEEAAGYDPTATLKWSDDGGNTWSTGRDVSIGKYQEYSARAVWRGLGMSRNRIYELTVDEPVKFVLMGAYSFITECRA